MKKKIYSKKLLLNRETISNLNYDEMIKVRGGDKTLLGESCETGRPCCNNPKAAPNKSNGAYCNTHNC